MHTWTNPMIAHETNSKNNISGTKIIKKEKIYSTMHLRLAKYGMQCGKPEVQPLIRKIIKPSTEVKHLLTTQKFRCESSSSPACTTERKLIETTTPIKFGS